MLVWRSQLVAVLILYTYPISTGFVPNYSAITMFVCKTFSVNQNAPYILEIEKTGMDQSAQCS
jgi:hypothetical protein